MTNEEWRLLIDDLISAAWDCGFYRGCEQCDEDNNTGEAPGRAYLKFGSAEERLENAIALLEGRKDLGEKWVSLSTTLKVK